MTAGSYTEWYGLINLKVELSLEIWFCSGVLKSGLNAT